MESAFGKETSKHINESNDNNDNNNVECQEVSDAWKLLGKRWVFVSIKEFERRGKHSI